MAWSIGYDPEWKRWIGYGVPAYCDHPRCMEKIDRGLSYVCGGEPYGGEHGCGLFFCAKHLEGTVKRGQLCQRCARSRKPFKPTRDHPQWVAHMLHDASWAEWRAENPQAVAALSELHAADTALAQAARAMAHPTAPAEVIQAVRSVLPMMTTGVVGGPLRAWLAEVEAGRQGPPHLLPDVVEAVKLRMTELVEFCFRAGAGGELSHGREERYCRDQYKALSAWLAQTQPSNNPGVLEAPHA